MLMASQLIGGNTSDIRIVQKFITEDLQGHRIIQCVVKSNNTTLKRKYGGPQIYTVKIKTQDGDDKIKPNTKVQVYCSCHDFEFRRAYCLAQQGSLLIPEGFLPQPPEKTNPSCNIKYCKHVSAALRQLIQTGG